MVLKVANRVKEVASGSGLGNLTLLGAVSGFRDFVSGIDVGDQCVYLLLDLPQWEIGIGTLVSSSELSRDTILDSSETTTPVNSTDPGSPIKITMSSNQKTLGIVLEATRTLFTDENDELAAADPFRKAVLLQTVTAMKALENMDDNTRVVCLGQTAVADGKGGLFRWDQSDATAPDNVDTFRPDTLGTGLWKRTRIDVQNLLMRELVEIDSGASEGGALRLYTNTKASNANAWFAWVTERANSVSRFVGRLNQASSQKNFLSLFSLGTNADRIELHEPVVLPTRTSETLFEARSLSWLSGISRLAFGAAAGFWEIPLTKGGYIVGTYASVTALKAVDAAALFANGQVALVLGVTDLGDCPPFYVTWTSASTGTEDLYNVFRPTVGTAASGSGRWLRSTTTMARAFSNADATPSVANGNYFTTVGTTNITDFDDAYEGQIFVVQRGASDIKIVHDGSKIDLNGVDVTLTATNPRAFFFHQNGVHRLLNAGAGGDNDAFADLASAATTDLYSVPSKKIRVTGTTGITSFGTAPAGVRKTVRFASALVLTYNATSMITTTGGNLALSAGSALEAISLGSGNWYVIPYGSGGASQVWDAVSYGIVSDGVTDNTSAMNTLLATVLAAGGGVIDLPTGVVLCTGQLTYAGSNLKIRGKGQLASTLSLTHTAAPAFLLGPTATQGLEIVFEDMALSGADSQILLHQRYLRGLRLNRVTATSVGSLVKMGASAASGPAYILEINECNIAAYQPNLTRVGGSGTFVVGETITGGTSGVTAKIRSINGSVLTLYVLSGTFTNGETITGGTSGATGAVSLFKRGRHLIEIENGSGGLFVYDSQVEGAYDSACDGVYLTSNVYTRFDQLEIKNSYWGRFNHGINATDARAVNVTINDNRLDENMTLAAKFYVTSATSKVAANVGFETVVFRNNFLGSGIGPVKGVSFGNDRSDVAVICSSVIVEGLEAHKITGPLLALRADGANSTLSNVIATGIRGYEVQTGVDLVTLFDGNNTGLVNCYLDDIHGRGTASAVFDDLISISGTPPTSNIIGYNLSSFYSSGKEINGTILTRTRGDAGDLKGRPLCAFRLTITNTAGTLQHKITCIGENTNLPPSDLISAINGASASLTNTPTGADGSTAMAGGGKIGSVTNNVFYFDTLTQTVNQVQPSYSIVFNSCGTALTAIMTVPNIDINGFTRQRPAIVFSNATTGVDFALTTANIASGKAIVVEIKMFLAR